MSQKSAWLNSMGYTDTEVIQQYMRSKMAEVVEEEIKNALNMVVSTAEQSGNMRKVLKEKIFETVSTLRQLFVKLKVSGDKNYVR